MDLWVLEIALPIGLAVVAAVSYLLGRRRKAVDPPTVLQAGRELRRALAVADELERIAQTVRRSLAKHHTIVSRFKDRVGKLGDRQQAAAWKQLCREAEEILKPTLQLANRLAAAYDEIRQQSANLMAFSEVRTDPLTGVSNRRGLDDALAAQFALMTRYDAKFSLAVFDIDHFKKINDQEGHLHGDRILRELAGLMDESARETDLVARYGGEEFVIVMPQTELEGACTFAERLRARVEQQMSLTISGGVTAALDGDSQDSLLARADAALYAAKSAGRNCVFRHTGEQMEAIVEEVPGVHV